MSSAPSAPARPASSSIKPGMTGTVLLAFGLVYFFWGSTYTAIRIAARPSRRHSWVPADASFRPPSWSSSASLAEAAYAFLQRWCGAWPWSACF